MTCTNCGAETSATDRFCATCGTPVEAVVEPTQPIVAAPVLPAAAPTAAPTIALPTTAPAAPQLDWRALLSGNWVGAGVTAAVIVAVAGLGAIGLALLAKPVNFGVDNSLTLVATILAAVFGADFVAHATVDGDTVRGSIGLIPVLLSLATAWAGLRTFRRVTAGYPSGNAALGDAARVGLLVAVPLLIASLVFRSDTKEVGQGWAADLMDFFGVQVSFGAWPASAFFLGFVSVFTVLALSCFLRRDWWGPQVQRVHDWVAAPIHGSLLLLWSLPLAGLVGLAVLLAFGDSNTDELHGSADWRYAIAGVLALLANGGMALLAMGSGAEYGSGGTADGQSDTDMSRLATITDTEPGLWIAPVVLVVVLFLAAYVVARRTAESRHILRNLAIWTGGLFVTLPILFRLTSAHGSYAAGGSETSRGHGFVGPNGFEAVFFMVGIALLCALAVARMSNALDLGEVRDQVRRLGQFQPRPGD
jgi:hypothetical protein